MKKKQSNCKCHQAVRRCVFRVRSTDRQEMLQPKALLSGNTLQIMLNNGLERPCPLNVRAHTKIYNEIEPSFPPQAYEKHTVH